MIAQLKVWSPALILGFGALITVGVKPQRTMELRQPLEAAVPAGLDEYTQSDDLEISAEEQRVAGMSDYLLRTFSTPGAPTDARGFSLYVGYYEQQMQGRTIHSPKNCLPGAGWEALTSNTVAVATPDGDVQVNRYLLKREQQKALVLYWYQGRGRIEANEYRVKFDLLRDAALRRRSDEALVRIVVDVRNDNEEEALAVARRAAERLIPSVYAALPE